MVRRNNCGSHFALTIKNVAMKKVVLFSLLMAFLTIHVCAQEKGAKKKKSSNTTIAKKPSTKMQNNSAAVVLRDTSAHQAYGSRSRLSIADPLVNTMNQRSAGADVRLSGSNIVGMPKGTYGIANGKILLRNSTATSSGTGYGSGAVGTGTAIQGVGTSESTIGVNGKSPYAGSWLWGDKSITTRLPVRDSLRRQ
jgi:hypothetical protein